MIIISIKSKVENFDCTGVIQILTCLYFKHVSNINMCALFIFAEPLAFCVVLVASSSPTICGRVARQLHTLMLVCNLECFKRQTLIFYCAMPSASVVIKLQFKVNLFKCQFSKFCFFHGFKGPLCYGVFGSGSYATESSDCRLTSAFAPEVPNLGDFYSRQSIDQSLFVSL